MDERKAAWLCATPDPLEAIKLIYEVPNLNALDQTLWVPGIRENSDHTFEECFAHIRHCLYAVSRRDIPQWVCSVKMDEYHLNVFEKMRTTMSVVDMVMLRGESVILGFLRWVFSKYPSYAKVVCAHIVDRGYRNKYYMLYKALDLKNKPELRRHVISPLRHVILNLHIFYPNVQNIEEYVLAMEKEKPGFPDNTFLHFFNLRGPDGATVAFADMVNLAYTYEQQMALGRHLSLCFTGFHEVFVSSDDTWKILRGVSPLDGWLPGLNDQFRVVYDNVLEVMMTLAPDVMEKAFVIKQMKAVRSYPYHADDTPNIRELLDTMYNSFVERIPAFVRSCMNHRKALHKTLPDRIESLCLPNGY